MRVHELAKEYGLSSKELLDKLHEFGIEAKSHMSSLDDTAMELAREALAGATVPPPTPPAAGPAPKPEAAKPETAKPETAKPETVKPQAVKPKAKEPQSVQAPAPKAPPRAEAKPAPAPTPSPRPTPPTAPPSKPAAAVEEPAASPPPEKVIRVRGAVVVKDLATMLGMRPNMLIAELMRMNVLAAINQRVELNIAKQIAEKHGFTLEHEKRGETEHKPASRRVGAEDEEEKEDRPEDMVPRPPVVTILGHVDHGKTSILDRIRNASVAAGESGGITQHIGAYTVDVNGRSITFLDTPGHAAFTAMRARGANLTDIAVIVVAADDGVMPQTREAIKHARAAEVAIMVAINKMDLPGANPDRVRQQLQAEGLSPEDWGGETICCEVSAHTGAGLEHLLEMILLQSEVLELKANPARRANGYVIEAQLEPGMGPTATLLVTGGTLKLGDAVLCGTYWGRVRALINDHGVKVKSAKPSTPIKCLGLSGVPDAGVAFRACSSDRAARSIASREALDQRTAQANAPRKTSLDFLYQQLKDNERIELKLILKADTQGSVEAITHALGDIKSDKVALNIILGGTGNITTNDVMLASASNAIAIGFHVAKEPGVDALAKHEGVEIRLHSVIYELLDEVREAMTGLLAPQLSERVTGRALVKQMFTIGKTGRIAGCMVTSGTVASTARARVKRQNETIYEGAVASLRHFQDEVAEVRESQECGIRLDRYSDMREGDILEFYEIQQIKQTL